jgi:uncharacterized protein YecA (UPF0149 family)
MIPPEAFEELTGKLAYLFFDPKSPLRMAWSLFVIQVKSTLNGAVSRQPNGQPQYISVIRRRLQKPPVWTPTGVGLRPKKGFDWNPLLGYPRNQRCFCGSGQKFKYCCANRMPETLKKKEAALMGKFVKEVTGAR